MSTFRKLFERTRNQLRLPSQRAMFLRSRCSEPVLARHENVESLLDTLSGAADEPYSTREELTRAMLRVYGNGSRQLWSSVLLIAFYRCLSRLRGRLVCSTLGSGELDQLVIGSFLEALEEVSRRPARDRLAMRLRQQTNRLVFQAVREENLRITIALPEEEHTRIYDPDFEVMAELFLAFAEPRLPRETADVIRATMLGKETLRSYLARTGLGLEQYQRIKRARVRSAERLRKLLLDCCASRALD